jgi:hypothetical protein
MSYIGAQMMRNQSFANPPGEGVTVRPSSTANFYVDSTDKLAGGSGDFTINKNQSLFNGFFHRIAVAEVVMDWGLPNVAEHWGNNTMTVINGVTAEVITAKIPDGFYTAVQALTEICAALNAQAVVLADPLRLTVQFDGDQVRAVSTGAGNDPFYVVWLPFAPTNDPPFALARQLFSSAQLAGAAVQDTQIMMSSPRVLGTTYVDIVSPQLTYNQDLKDATTDTNSRDVLYRWYIAQDNVPHEREKMPLVYPAVAPAPAVSMLTETNIPVLQGYTPFVLRRALPYPKQVRWNSEQPIGNVTFQCYDDRGRIISTDNFPFNGTTGFGGANFQFQMSMLLSED